MAQSPAFVLTEGVATAAFFIDSGHEFGAMQLRGCIIAEPDRSKGPIWTIRLW